MTDSVFKNTDVKAKIDQALASINGPRTPLCDIMQGKGSDKSSKHNYTRVYYSLLADVKDKPLDFFELGMGSIDPDIISNMGPNGTPGASHFGWQDFLTQANIYAVDIDTKININEGRIRTYHADQTNPASIQKLWETLPDASFDFMLDDALHLAHANICFFIHAFHKLKSGGIFVIEDVRDSEKDELLKFMESLKLGHIKAWHVPLPWPENYKQYSKPPEHYMKHYGTTEPHYDNQLIIIQKD